MATVGIEMPHGLSIETGKERSLAPTHSPRSSLAAPLAAASDTATLASRQQYYGPTTKSSTIIEEEVLGDFIEETVRYVEVPEYVQVPRYVVKKQVVEVEKKVDRIETEYVEKIVEVPQIQIIEKTVEVPQYQEVIRQVPTKQTVQVMKEVIRHVPKIETRTTEKVFEVPGEVIHVPKPYTVDQSVKIPKYVDKETPVVISQTVEPRLCDSPDHVIDMDVVEHAPEIIEVEVQVPKPVPAQVIASGVVDQYHRVVKDVPAAQYNTLLKMLNPHISSDEAEFKDLPYQKDTTGHVPMLDDVKFVVLPPNESISGGEKRHRQTSSRPDGVTQAKPRSGGSGDFSFNDGVQNRSVLTRSTSTASSESRVVQPSRPPVDHPTVRASGHPTKHHHSHHPHHPKPQSAHHHSGHRSPQKQRPQHHQHHSRPHHHNYGMNEDARVASATSDRSHPKTSYTANSQHHRAPSKAKNNSHATRRLRPGQRSNDSRSVSATLEHGFPRGHSQSSFPQFSNSGRNISGYGGTYLSQQDLESLRRQAPRLMKRRQGCC